MAVRFVSPQVQALGLTGVFSPGAKLRFYDAGTTNPRNVYTDDGLSIAYSQPIEADEFGVWPAIFVGTGVYKVTIHDEDDALIATYDDIDPSLSTNAGALAVASGGTGATTAAGARTNLGVPSQTAFDDLDNRVADAETILDNPILAASVSVTFAASLTPDFTAAETRHVTLTGNITTLSATATVGQKVRLVLIQDATGNRTWVVDTAVWKFPGNVVPPLSTTAAAIDVLEGYCYSSGVIHVTSFKRQDAYVPVAILEDQKTSGTAGGTFTSGADRTRDLTTEVSDLSAMVSLAANQFTLGAGVYLIEWSAPASGVDGHQSMLYNATDAAITQRGSSEDPSDEGLVTRSVGSAVVSISSSKAFEIRHRCTTTEATSGFGVAASFGTEVYTRVIVRRFP